MKCIFLIVLAGVIAIEAKPEPYRGHGGRRMGLGTGIGTGLDNNGMESLGGLDTGLAGLGMGLGRRASEYSQGNSFADNQYNSGASGFGNQGFYDRGFNNFHNVGQHHSSHTSINHDENTDNHDIGGSQSFDTGAQSNNGYNQFYNGRSRFGNGYENGRQMVSFL